VIAWAIETLIASTLLMLVVLAIRQPVRRAFGPDMAYALWALPALRMILPPLPESWRESAAAPIAQASNIVATYVIEPIGVATGDSLPVDAAVSSGPGLWPILFAAWAIGAVGFITYHLITHSRFCARVQKLAGAVRMVAAGNVQVIETAAANGPLAFGIWRKYVAFPRDFAERYDPLERDLALAHELGHHARGDLIANWVALVVLGLHWFNPVAWRAFRAFRADQEMACDALVLAGRDAGLRHAYGRAIVKSAHGGAVSAACHLHTVNELKGRLRMLTHHERTSRTRLLAGGGAIGALMLASLAVTASGTHAAERVRSGIEKTTGVDLASLELPMPQVAPPAPPAPPPASSAEAVPTPPAPPEADGVRRQRMVVIRDKDGKVTTREFSGTEDGALQALEGDGKVRRFAFRTKDGKRVASGDHAFDDMPELARLKNMPEFTSMNCGDRDGKPGEMVIHTQDGDKRKTIICTNRIERQARVAENSARVAEVTARVAENNARIAAVNVVRIERDAKASALAGLERARANVARAEGMTDSKRSLALNAIDEAIAEMRSDKE
jgi:beta-lactamase regulating signal transducer with metallopeptidase domain